MLIKICGVKSAEIALFAAQKGAHLIGMVLTPGFKRSVSMHVAKKIVQALRGSKAEPVAVFVSETPEEIETICKEIGVKFVQYYQNLELSSDLRRIYVNTHNVPLRPNDFLLLDGSKPGISKQIDPSTFTRPSTSFILAGGLNVENVQEMICTFLPMGVDVSSGVERDGEKCPVLIEQFIEQVRGI